MVAHLTDICHHENVQLQMSGFRGNGKNNSQMTMRIMQNSWIPEPNRELRIMGY